MIRLILAIILAVVLLPFHPSAVVAQKASDCANQPKFHWVEERTKYFVLLYVPEEIIKIAPFDEWKVLVDQEYERFQSQFQAELNGPITIQFYPTKSNFLCVNEMTSEIGMGQSHTTVGQKEISFLVEDLSADPLITKSTMINDFRYEIAGLFVDEITDNKAPVGLLYGIKLYAMEPASIHNLPSGESLPVNSTPAQSWRYIWENEATAQNQTLRLNALSIVAYLSETFGWVKLVNFLHAIPSSENYQRALSETFDEDLFSLESQWELYYPSYFAGKWKSHAIYGLDLAGIEALIQRGAYIDGGEFIKQLIPSLEATNQHENVLKAQELLEKAQKGEEAGNLVIQCRQALLDGKYQDSILLSKKATEIYQQLGDQRRIPELVDYQTRANEILSLRLASEELIQQLNNQPGASDQLRRVGEKLSAYNDQESLSFVQASLDHYYQGKRREKEELGFRISAAILIMLIGSIWSIRIKRRPEVL